MSQECNRTWELREIDLFEGVPEEEIDRFATTLGTHRYQAGETIMGPESPAEAVYIVLEGKVRLFHRGPDGREVTVGVLERGRIFGVSALFGAEANGSALRAQALTDTVACLARGEDLREMLERYPDVMARLTQLLVSRLLEVEQQLNRLAARGARARLADELARLAREQGEPRRGGGWQITKAPTHAELGRQIGASRETVTRLLAGIEHEGLIAREGRRIVVPDPDALTSEGRADR